MAKEGGDPRVILKQICQLVKGPVSAEVVSTNADDMIKEGREWAKLDEHIVVKIPFIREGVKAIKTLSGEGIRINTTLCFSPMQALIAAKAGSSYISPFVGRLDDISTDGMELVKQILEIYRAYGYKTEVLVASVRHPMHIVQAARMGAHICTCPAAVIEQCMKHPLTDTGLEKFLKDWAAANKK
jgi:transaldolase